MNAPELRVIDKGDSEKDRAEVQKTMLGPEVLDSEHHKEIVFKSTGAESTGQGQWTLHGNLILHGQTRPVTVQVTLKDGHYIGETTVKLTRGKCSAAFSITSSSELPRISKIHLGFRSLHFRSFADLRRRVGVTYYLERGTGGVDAS